MHTPIASPGLECDIVDALATDRNVVLWIAMHRLECGIMNNLATDRNVVLCCTPYRLEGDCGQSKARKLTIVGSRLC